MFASAKGKQKKKSRFDGETNVILERILNYSMVDDSKLFRNIFALWTKYNVRRR